MLLTYDNMYAEIQLRPPNGIWGGGDFLKYFLENLAFRIHTLKRSYYLVHIVGDVHDEPSPWTAHLSRTVPRFCNERIISLVQLGPWYTGHPGHITRIVSAFSIESVMEMALSLPYPGSLNLYSAYFCLFHWRSLIVMTLSL